MNNLRQVLGKVNLKGSLRFDEPMANHTSFRVGGPADAFAVPDGVDDVSRLVRACAEAGIPVFVLGEGANILVADAGIRGLVMDMRLFAGLRTDAHTIHAGAGLDVSALCEEAAAHELAGVEFLYSMPGSVGGAVWMNARCYGKSISEVLESVTLVDEAGERVVRSVDPKEFDYKRSPYQGMRAVIVEATFSLEPGDGEAIRKAMEEYRADRERKGHFAAPSAGSVFKNDRRFGSPTGKLIDDLGLRGHRIGGAQVSGYHANIFINAGGARAEDLRKLMELAEQRVYQAYGFRLEREVILVGAWNDARHEEHSG